MLCPAGHDGNGCEMPGSCMPLKGGKQYKINVQLYRMKKPAFLSFQKTAHPKIP